MRSRTKSAIEKRSRGSQRKRKSQPPKKAHAAKAIAPTFTVKLAEDGAYYVQMAPNAYAPAMHIGNFISKNKALAWIKDESAAWFEELVAAGM